MADNAVNKSITFEIDEDKKGVDTEQNSFPLAIQELGEGLFEKYPDKTSLLSDENILGMIRCEALNEYMQVKYGFRYSTLDIIVKEKKSLSISKDGYGIVKFIEIVKSIQATFEQMQVPLSTMDRLRGRGR